MGNAAAVTGPRRPLERGVTIQQLEQKAGARTDTQAAEEMQKAKEKLFAGFHQRQTA